jgi:hypothetical protein
MNRRTGRKVNVMLRLDAGARDALSALADEAGLSMGACVEIMVREQFRTAARELFAEMAAEAKAEGEPDAVVAVLPALVEGGAFGLDR